MATLLNFDDTIPMHVLLDKKLSGYYRVTGSYLSFTCCGFWAVFALPGKAEVYRYLPIFELNAEYDLTRTFYPFNRRVFRQGKVK